MEHFVIIVNAWKLLIIITNRSILDIAAALDPPLSVKNVSGELNSSRTYTFRNI